MAFFRLILKAKKLERARAKYEEEKQKSIEISKGRNVQLSRRRFKSKSIWKKVVPHDSWLHRKAIICRTDGTFENYAAKSILGFLGGVFLAYLLFFILVLQLNFTLSSATTVSSILGVILSLGLAFSPQIRCVVFLLLPQFFSKRGRQALIAYAFVLAFTGPARNILRNTSVLSESLTCAQEQLRVAVKSVIDLIKQPFEALKIAISKVIRTVKVIVKRIKQTLVAIKRLVLSILKVIVAVFRWLGSIVNICNKKLGTPFDRCQRVFDGAVADCKAKLGPLFSGICNLTYIVGALCYIVKPLDFICMLVSYVADTIVDSVKKKIKKFTNHVKAMFYVKLKFSHSFHFATNQTKTAKGISGDIITEIRSRTDEFLAVFDWIGFLTSFFVIFLLLRVLRYRHKWLTSDRFDNQYITDDLRAIDLIRARQDKETVLPLNPVERNKYASLTSVTLIKTEKTRLAKSAVFLCLATCKLCVYMLADYGLYWTLSVIRRHARFESKFEQPNSVTIHVTGDGYLTDLYRSIAKAFTPDIQETRIDTRPCLPVPIPPDYDRYIQIVFLLALAWITAIFEPYGLRLRQVVMCRYYPERAKQRATWLYNHIIRSRGSFLKFARRQLRRRFGMNGGQAEKVTFRERCFAVFPLLGRLFGQRENACLLCGSVERSGDPHVKCQTPNCIGLFCSRCFEDLRNICTICKSPMDYGDLSDISEEKDSSDDQLPVLKSEKKEREKKEEAKEDISGDIDGARTDEIDETSSEAAYSYTYQDESPEELEIQRIPFKDVEEQKIRDDVTIQTFREPLEKDVKSSSNDSSTCFVIRKLRKRFSPDSDSASSTSIADTESWPTEEIEEEEIELEEIDDLPLVKRKKKRKKILKAFGICFGERITERVDKKQSRKSSLIDRIVKMFQRRSYSSNYRKRDRTAKSDETSSYDEEEMLLETRDRIHQTTETTKDTSQWDEVEDSKNYNSHFVRRRVKSKSEPSELEESTDVYQKVSRSELPRYLEPISKRTDYYEIDEKESIDHRSWIDCSGTSDNVAPPSEIKSVKRYLPMYQRPELIEELKEHEKMKLLRKREGSDSELSFVHEMSSPSRNSLDRTESFSLEGRSLPYQETAAFRELLNEFRRTRAEKYIDKTSS